ncbi:MAG: DnaD domain protein [Roseburia sp.]|nr:DnaD domain protein [Roseburia sp.]
MSKINLYSDKDTTTTSISNVFIDEYMSGANGEFVKIYLYLLRQLNSANADFSLSEIADKFEHTEKDVKRALCYWERMQLLHLDYDADENLIAIRLMDALSKTGVEKTSAQQTTSTEIAQAVSSNVPKVPAKKSYSADDIKQFTNQDAVTELVFIAEQYLGRTLTATDLNTIFYFYDGLHLSLELIEYLIEYCVSNHHTSIRYIEKVALAWAENGYQTVEQAKQANGQYNQTYSAVMKSLGITGRNLVTSETTYIEKWKNNLGFSIELIQKACEKTIQAIHEPSFEYTDRILNNWKECNITSLEDVAKADTEHQKRKKTPVTATRTIVSNKFTAFDQRSYDDSRLEKMLLNTSTQ